MGGLDLFSLNFLCAPHQLNLTMAPTAIGLGCCRTIRVHQTVSDYNFCFNIFYVQTWETELISLAKKHFPALATNYCLCIVKKATRDAIEIPENTMQENSPI